MQLGSSCFDDMSVLGQDLDVYTVMELEISVFPFLQNEVLRAIII